jgi:hypothetical protein
MRSQQAVNKHKRCITRLHHIVQTKSFNAVDVPSMTGGEKGAVYYSASATFADRPQFDTH